MRYVLMSVIVVILLPGCASNIPLEIQRDITRNGISLDAVQSDFDRYQDQQVRWGGTIAAIENNQDDTWIEVVHRPLDDFGEPLPTDRSEGRFLVRIPGFLDPAIYRVNRPITVFGRIENRIVREIDEYPYTYPLVQAQSHYLWNDDAYRRYAWHYPYPYYSPYYYAYAPFHFGFNFGHWYGHHHGYGYGFGFHHHRHW